MNTTLWSNENVHILWFFCSFNKHWLISTSFGTQILRGRIAPRRSLRLILTSQLHSTVSRRGFTIVTPRVSRAVKSSPKLNCTIQCVCGETTVFTARQKQLLLTESQPTTTQTNNKRQHNTAY